MFNTLLVLLCYANGQKENDTNLIIVQVVHRRLAARNVLLGTDHTVKITGFGPLTADPEEDGNAKQRVWW